MTKGATYWALGLSSIVVGGAIYFIFRDKIRVVTNSFLVPISSFQKRLVAQANFEADKFEDYNEISPQTARIIQQYWADGVGYNYEISDITNLSWQNEHYWSAAFISWLMKVSGAGSEFDYSERHATYVRASIENAQDGLGDIRGFDAKTTKPNYGDIVCKRRGSSDATYNDISPNETLHCDVVVDVKYNKITVIGGNVNNRVERSFVTTDKSGYISDDDYFVVIQSNIKD